MTFTYASRSGAFSDDVEPAWSLARAWVLILVLICALNWLLSSGAGSQYGFGYNAAGLMTQVVNGGTNYTYAYGDNGLIQQRNSPWRSQTISRDSRGRITSQQATCWGTYFLGETMGYRPDSRLASYVTSGMVTTGTLNTYAYDARGRLLVEPYIQVSTSSTTYLPLGRETAQYAFDSTVNNITDVESGLGVRTMQYINSNSADGGQSQDKFQRAVQDYYYSGDGYYSPYQFTYDAAGNVSSHNIVANGTTYTAHTMVWDAFGRLNKISQRNTGTSDYDWTTVYDGLGRRVQTTWQPMSSGTNSGASSYLRYYYDPQVEFLELGINNNGSRQWSVYGPDLNGIYGGQQGVGGAESYMTEGTAPIVQNINNFFGDTVGMAYTPVGMPGALYMQSYGLTLGAYGPQPGTGLYSNLIPQWRGRYADWTGYIWMGARYYDVRSGRFLSADPLGHDSSMSLYDYANGDPLNGLDPDGRCSNSTAWSSDSSSSSSYGYGYSSSSYGSGGSSLSDQMNEAAYVAMHPLSEQQQEWPTFDQVIDGAISLAVQATVGLSMSVAESVATHFYNGMTGTDINTGESISGWSRLGNAAMFAADIAPMVGEVKLGGGMLDAVSNVGRISDDVDVVAGGSINVYHATNFPDAVLNGIDVGLTSPTNRFGQGFYTTTNIETAMAETQNVSVNIIKYQLDLTNTKVLDLTDEAIAKSWGYSGGARSSSMIDIGNNAAQQGFNVIKFNSTQGSGVNYMILNNSAAKKVLMPKTVFTVGE